MEAATQELLVERRIESTVLRLIRGDLTALEADAIVFYAREDLSLGSGFGTAIQSRGGGAVQKELSRIGGVSMGEAVITSAGGLSARRLIHACGPKFLEPGWESKLEACMLSALRLAAEHRLASIACPPMGAGFYGVPLAGCVRVMLGAIRDFLKQPSSIEEIVICVLDRREFEAFRKPLESA